MSRRKYISHSGTFKGTFITQILCGQKQIKLGAVTPTRDFNYVKDTCAGFFALAKSQNAIGAEVNIGSGFEISIGDLFQKP